MLIYIKKLVKPGYDIWFWHLVLTWTREISKDMLLLSKVQYRKDIKVYIKQETVYDIYIMRPT